MLFFPAAVFAVPRFNGITADERIVVGYVIEEAGPGQTVESEEQDRGGQENGVRDYKEEEAGKQDYGSMAAAKKFCGPWTSTLGRSPPTWIRCWKR